MAISVSFGGQVIYRPGSFSRTEIDLSGGFPLSPTGLIGIIGESTSGAPGANEVDLGRNYFTPDQLTEIRAKYGSGALVDACNFLFSPAVDAAISSGAQAVYIYKTNASVRASLTLANTYGSLRAYEYGVGGNRISYENAVTPEVVATVVSSAAFDPADLIEDDQFAVRVNGSEKYVFTVPAGITNKTTFDAAIALAANWSNAAVLTSGLELSTSGAANAVILTFKMADESSVVPVLTNRIGYARTFQINEVTGTPLADMSVAVGLFAPAANAKCELTLNQMRDLLIETDSVVGGDIILEAGYFDAGNLTAEASIEVDATSIKLTVDAVETTFLKSGYSTLSELIAEMSLQANWSFNIPDVAFNLLPLSALEQVNVGASANAAAQYSALIKKDYYDASAFFAQSLMVELVAGATVVGLPDAKTETVLTGGALGATTDASVLAGLTVFEGLRLNSIVPLFSRDASEDILDGLTDVGSDYTIDSIHQNCKNHLSLTATVKQKSERQGYLSYKASYANCQTKAAELSYFRAQLCIQDMRSANALGTIQWFQPWALSCILAGARAGCPVGTPMTFKFMNVSGIRHTAQPMRTSDINIVADFNPRTQYESAIKSGITFLEAPQTGGYRWVVDNTTYSKDGNWVYNRAHVIYDADVIAYDFRKQLEDIYVGVKNTVKASSVKSTCESILSNYLGQGLTVSTADAPNGYKSLTVSVNGNIIQVNVTLKVVEGLDYVLSTLYIQRAQSEA